MMRDRIRSPAVLLSTLAIVLVLGFGGATWYSQHAAFRIDAIATAIRDNAVPSVAAVATVRNAARRIQMKLTEATGAPLDARNRDRAQVVALFGSIADAQQAYSELPKYPDEPALADRLHRDISTLNESATAVLEALDREDVTKVRELLNRRVAPTISDLDGVATELMRINLRSARRDARDVARLRRSAALLAYGLDGLTIAITIGALILALRLTRQLELARQQRAEALAARSAELEMFSGRVAHDLKSPLASLSLRLDVLDTKETMEAMRADLPRLRERVRRMATTIDGLLQFAVAGAKPTGDLTTDVDPMLRAVVEECTASAEKERIALSIEPHPPTSVRCSAAALYSVVSNLVANAIKYTPEGGRPERRIELRVDRRGSTARIEVHDSGPGISPEMVERIFDPYVRATKTCSGIGLGLATVKRLIEAHGGHVGVAPSHLGGSCFWVELPQTAAIG